MLSWIIQITVASILFIFLVHHLIEFFKSTLTVPKIKDLVNNPSQKYENIYNIIREQPRSIPDKEYTLIDLLPTTDNEVDNPPRQSMKNELKQFLKQQLQER